MTSTQQTGLSSTRVQNSNSTDVAHLECCICKELLWKPVACQICETAFCFECITRWLRWNPNKCPNRCKAYTERKCPPMVAKLLAQLQITCFYRSNGCQEVLPYEALDKHEINCGYQFQQCTGCHSQILKKDLNNHETNCGSIKLTCEDCQLVYERGEAATKHSENICLREQLRQVREESKENKRVIQELNRQMQDESKENKRKIQELTQKVNEIYASKNCRSEEVIIRFDDLLSENEEIRWLPAMYKKLKWSEIAYGHESYFKQKHPTSGYSKCFTNNGSPHIAYFEDGGTISVQNPNEIFTLFSQNPNEMFTLVSLNACAAWNDNLELTITGYRSSVQTRTYSTTLLFGKIQTILLLWKNIDQVVLKSSGGTEHRASGGKGTHVVLTQLIIDNLSN